MQSQLNVRFTNKMVEEIGKVMLRLFLPVGFFQRKIQKYTKSSYAVLKKSILVTDGI